MNNDKTNLEELISCLKQYRDELQVRTHLGKTEIKDEYERLSDKLNELTRQYEPVRHAAADSAENVWAALKLAAEEMKEGFQRVRDSTR